jgi:hypothetical protein
VVQFSGTWQTSWPLRGGRLGTFRLTLNQGAHQIAAFPGSIAVDTKVHELQVARGADFQAEFDWPDDRLGADLTGDDITVINVSPALVGRISVEVTDPVTRTVRWALEGNPRLPLGNLGTFQLQRATAGAHRRTRLPIRIIVK